MNKRQQPCHISSNSAGHCESHGSKLHLLHSVSLPSQTNPPNSGTGLSHLLDLVWSPPPQGLEHGPHSSHSPRPPSTKNQFMV